MKRLTIIAAALGTVCLAPFAHAADAIGIFETVHESSLSFDETAAALESAIAASDLELHGSHDVRVPDDMHRARVYVLTSPAYQAAAATESPRTASAQVLRMAIYTMGDAQTTYINMANPVAHAMVFYSQSGNYDALLAAAGAAADKIRAVAQAVSGNAMSEQQEPMRTEKKYRKFNGDGPAKMMAKFRNWKESQLQVREASSGAFEETVSSVAAALASGTVAGPEDCDGWEVITQIRLSDDVVYFGLTNPYIEDKMVRINSRFRSEGKSEAAPYPGVDHVTALPTEVLVVNDGNLTRVVHYGQMWRMQLYFWDSGYRAFTANMAVPGNIADSIEAAIGQ